MKLLARGAELSKSSVNASNGNNNNSFLVGSSSSVIVGSIAAQFCSAP